MEKIHIYRALRTYYVKGWELIWLKSLVWGMGIL